MSNEVSEEFVEFVYRYRDASNFKAHGSIYLAGLLDKSEQDEIISVLDSNEFFIAEQVGIPPLYEKLYLFSIFDADIDHCWHEFVGFKNLLKLPEGQSLWGPATELVTKFRQVTQWNLLLSPHAYIA